LLNYLNASIFVILNTLFLNILQTIVLKANFKQTFFLMFLCFFYWNYVKMNGRPLSETGTVEFGAGESEVVARWIRLLQSNLESMNMHRDQTGKLFVFTYALNTFKMHLESFEMLLICYVICISGNNKNYFKYIPPRTITVNWLVSRCSIYVS